LWCRTTRSKSTISSGDAFGANLGACLWRRDLGKEGIEQDEEGLRTIRKVIKRLVDFKK